MRPSPPRILSSVLLATCASACDYTHDAVAPSYYGNMAEAGSGSVPPAAVSGSITTPSKSGTSKAMASAAGAPAQAKPMSADATATTMMNAATTAASSSASSCDLTGKWLLTVHKVTDGLGNLQTIHDYYYYELQQQGAAFSVTKSLKCGSDVIGGGAFAITVSYTAAMAGVMKHTTHDGRTGSSTSSAQGCAVEFAEQYTVGGATVPHYLDPSTALPSAEQMASAGNPGWEDWDEDGNPGITGICEGTVTGKIYTAARERAAFSGSVADASSLFKLAMEWDQEPNVMGFDGSPFLGSSAVRAADASLHFVQLARLDADQASGEDLTLCQRLVELAPTLTPEAAGM